MTALAYATVQAVAPFDFTQALPPGSGEDAPGAWFFFVLFGGMALAAALIVFVFFRKR